MLSKINQTQKNKMLVSSLVCRIYIKIKDREGRSRILTGGEGPEEGDKRDFWSECD